MLIEIAIGDAYGMGFEFASEDLWMQRPNDGRSYFPHPFHAIAPGCYTDDTQMSLAVAEVILTKGGDASKEDFAAAFVRAFRRDPRLGYSSGFHALLREVADGTELLARIDPSSKGAGSAMRACPIGFLPRLLDVRAVAADQASVTHDTLEGIAAAQAAAYMAHYAVYHLGPKDGLRLWLRRMFGSIWYWFDQPHEGAVPNEGIPAVNAALTAIEQGDTLTAILRAAVAFGGDVDTVAAIALGVAAHLLPPEAHDLPRSLHDGLEAGTHGHPYLAGLDRALHQRFPA